jgi:DNA recombination protein RmuC
MENWSGLLILSIGILIGGVIVFLSRKSGEKHAYEKGRSESQAAVAVLEERITNSLERLKERDSLVEKLENELKIKSDLTEKLHEENTGLRESAGKLHTMLENEIKTGEEKIKLLRETLETAEKRMSDAFRTLSSENLEKAGKSFWEFAETKMKVYQETARGELELRKRSVEDMVKPIRESLEKVTGKIEEIEKERAASFGAITTEINNLKEISIGLGDETKNLVKALRSPNVRGKWGEIQLQRVVEFAGMLEYCDFVQQKTIGDSDSKQRPDMIINLPNNRKIIVDSKVSLHAYLEAVESRMIN